MLDKIDFESEHVIRVKEEHYILINVSGLQDKIIINIYTSNN